VDGNWHKQKEKWYKKEKMGSMVQNMNWLNKEAEDISRKN